MTQKNEVMNVIIGIILCILITQLGIWLADVLGKFFIKSNLLPAGSGNPISSIFIAIFLGIAIRNTIGLSHLFQKGVSFTTKYALRLGIIFLGLRLSLTEALKLGAWGLPLIIVCIASGLLITLYITKKLGQSRRLGMLIASGTSICGITAIMAISPVLKAKENEVSYAVANITIFGLIGMVLYPYLAHLLFAGDPVKVGLFLGTAVHDTAQVTGSALMYSQMYDMAKVIDVATVTKLTRNLFIIVVIPLVAVMFFKQDKGQTEELPKWYRFIPSFVIGFLAFALLRTIGDMTVLNSGSAFGILKPDNWQTFHESISSFGSTYLLGMAMSAVGLSTDFRMFKGLGFKPFYIGLTAALSVGIVSYIFITLFGNLIVL